ncbi:uncharacterized protein LOC117887595 [Trachemys scripta elegans]|uniref:uncharacterized protein LOC117887595 n=1 Tax=Trachemys scripta elegans TaxID=31138 RepID=UPI0015522D9F|nr:uncharacterized protein LOC117887595 [Trachemys scripta elegans]
MVLMSSPSSTPVPFVPEPSEVSHWENIGATKTQKREWQLPDGRRALPRAALRPALLKLHQKTHGEAEAMAATVNKLWYAPGVFQEAKQVLATCNICAKFNPRGEPKCPPGARLWAYMPFERLQIDYSEMPKCQGFKYLLVIMCQITGWTKAFPTRRATALEMGKTLLNHVIPRFSPPRSIYSDQGTHFTAQIIQHIAKVLGITWLLHTPWRPPSSGQVKKMNQTLKLKLSKLCAQTGLKWLQALPLALLAVQTAPRGCLCLSPFELLFGRPYTGFADPGPVFDLATWGDEELTRYVVSLQTILMSLHRYAAQFQSLPADVPAHRITPGDWVYVKEWKHEPLQPWWAGPFQVLLTSHTAIRVRE